MIEWCEEDSLPSFVAFLSTRNQSVLPDRLDDERTTPVKEKRFPIVKNSNVTHQLRVNWYSTRVSLNCSESKPRNLWNPRSSRILSSCFLHEQVEAIVHLRNLVLHVLRTLSAVPASWRPNEVMRQIAVHLDRDDVPFF